jgi:hypothetical protein
MLLARGVTAELAGAVDLAFEPEGLVARIDIPLDHANAPKAEVLLPSLL